MKIYRGFENVDPPLGWGETIPSFNYQKNIKTIDKIAINEHEAGWKNTDKIPPPASTKQTKSRKAASFLGKRSEIQLYLVKLMITKDVLGVRCARTRDWFV